MTMQDLYDAAMKFYTDHPVFNVIGFFATIIGLPLAIYLFRKGSRKRLPIYRVRTINLVRDNIQKIGTVQILFAGNSINNLSLTRIALWNAGKETIDHSDVAANSQLAVEIANEFEILSSEILYQKNTANDFKVTLSENKKKVEISFDYFDLNEGIVLQLAHTGRLSNDIKLSGKIKSVDQIKRVIYRKSIFAQFLDRFFKLTFKTINANLFLGFIAIVTGLLCLYLAFASFPEHTKPVEPMPIPVKIVLVLVSLYYFYDAYQDLKRKIPKGFDIFRDEF